MNRLKNILFVWAKRKDLFRLCLTASVLLHLIVGGGYYLSSFLGHNDSETIEFEEVNVQFDDIPPELIGGTSNPAPVEKQEWVEGTKKGGPDPENNEDDLNPNKLSGTGTDKDGYLYSYNGDKPPTPIIDFDVKQFFPAEAKAAGISEKAVTLKIQVDEKGQLISASVSSNKAGYGFDEAALKVIRLARFSPGYIKGRPVKMNHTMTIYFQLED